MTKGTANARMSKLNRLVLPDLGSKTLQEITREDIARILSKIEKAAGPVDETLKVIRSVFTFAVGRALFSGTPPTVGITKRQSSEVKARALSDDELRNLWKAAGEYGYPFGHALRLLMLTGQRLNEISHARWSEIDWNRKILTIPVERVKNRAGDHEVPLSDAAIAVLEDAQKAYEATGLKSGYVFPSDIGSTPITGWSKVKPKIDRGIRAESAVLTDIEKRAIKAKGALRAETRALKAEALRKISEVEVENWRIHDLRHTFITRVRDGEENADGEIIYSAPLDVLQAVVNHEITAGITGRYDHGDIQRRYRLRKREVLVWWARKLMDIVEELPEVVWTRPKRPVPLGRLPTSLAKSRRGGRRGSRRSRSVGSIVGACSEGKHNAH
ncbi:tyrosine-type recombinase/integrase [Microvirga sp. 2YAF29]|uniref:tyrosine-type recombinase/integrase n=1 Tax=Microvirga sp. 2YAF29 TaxID=3233031 RepID=UPI003F98B3AD